MTFFAFDFLMSLSPHWYSTIFGVYFFSGCVLGFFALMTPGVILGGMFSGAFTPTEAAAVACLYALFLGFVVYRTLEFRQLGPILVETAETTGLVLVLDVDLETAARRLDRPLDKLENRGADYRRRLDELIARYPVRGLKGAVGTQLDQLTLLGGKAASVARLEARVIKHLGFKASLNAVGQVYPPHLQHRLHAEDGPLEHGVEDRVDGVDQSLPHAPSAADDPDPCHVPPLDRHPELVSGSMAQPWASPGALRKDASSAHGC